MWTLFRQESDNPQDLVPISIHETEADAEAIRTVLKRRDGEAV